MKENTYEKRWEIDPFSVRTVSQPSSNTDENSRQPNTQSSRQNHRKSLQDFGWKPRKWFSSILANTWSSIWSIWPVCTRVRYTWIQFLHWPWPECNASIPISISPEFRWFCRCRKREIMKNTFDSLWSVWRRLTDKSLSGNYECFARPKCCPVWMPLDSLKFADIPTNQYRCDLFSFAWNSLYLMTLSVDRKKKI